MKYILCASSCFFSHLNAFNICSYCFVYQLSLPSYYRVISSIQLLSRVQLFVTPWTAERQASLSIINFWSLLKLIFIVSVMPSNHVIPFSSRLQSFPAQGLFQWFGSLHQVAKVMELHIQNQPFQWIFGVDFYLDWLVWSPCSRRDSQESSPTPQFKSINSSALSFLYSPTFTSIHNFWKNHSFD